MPTNRNNQADHLDFHRNFDKLYKNALETNLVNEQELYDAICLSKNKNEVSKDHRQNLNDLSLRFNDDNLYEIILFSIIFVLCLIIGIPIVRFLLEQMLGVRCFVPNNYLVWEATRPISDCSFCEGIKKPLILPNMTQEEFLPFAYLPQPIIIKNAISHWPAKKLLTYDYLKRLYYKYPNLLDSFSEECQFLHFKSSFKSLRNLFEMPKKRTESGKPSWYVGFSNCQDIILNELRQLYPRPHFLPKDAEIPHTDYIFLGYDQGAVMHLDYIPRLMWQAQLRGNKTWMLSPTPECDMKCTSFTFYVEPGDAVLIDTRIWYHGTSVTQGQFSLTIQSEYG